VSFDLHLNSSRWLSHVRKVVDQTPGIAPVIKGNGYGLSRDLLASEARGLNLDTVCVGTYTEVPEALLAFDGDVLVLTPWPPFVDAVYDQRVIHTLSRAADVTELATREPDARVVVEAMTSMARHGVSRDELSPIAAHLDSLRLEGLAVHLPIAGSNLAEAEKWAAVLEASQLQTATMWVSHLLPAELAELAESRPQLSLRPRIGTSLWLGDIGALSVKATVLDVHSIVRGERVGYRQRAMPRDGHLLVVAGGTSHGVGLEAPRANSSAIDRGKEIARGGLAAAGLSLSPFSIAGKQRWFAEPPHMQSSMIFLPSDVSRPVVGDLVDVAVRYTIASFDRIVRH
jgi:alanine racemase